MIQNTETYLAELMAKMIAFRDSYYSSTEQQDAALTELLAVPVKMLAQMEQNCVTTPAYWECACDNHEIHLYDGRTLECPKCNVEAEEASDARLSDVLLNLMAGGYLNK